MRSSKRPTSSPPCAPTGPASVTSGSRRISTTRMPNCTGCSSCFDPPPACWRANKRTSRPLAAGADQEDGDEGFVADFVNGAAEEKVGEKPVTVSGHGDEVAILPFGGFQNFRGRIP